MVGGNLADTKILDKSLAQMFEAYQAGSPLSVGSKPDLRMLLRRHFDDVHHDGHVHLQQQSPDHEHEQGDFSLYHDGPGGHHHDDDGHVHLNQQGRHHEHEQRDINLYHDGPGGHHHDDDGHVHHRAQEDDGVTQGQGLRSDEGITKQQSLSDITLTIAKLLFHLSQA